MTYFFIIVIICNVLNNFVIKTVRSYYISLHLEEKMRKRFAKFTAGFMAGIMLVGNISTEILASPSAGLTKYASDVVATKNKPTAGASLSFAESMITSKASAKISSNNVPIMKADYASCAVAQVNN